MRDDRAERETISTTGAVGPDPRVEHDRARPILTPSSVIRPSRVTIPATLGRYRLLGLRGRGGMGAVYEARDPELDRRVAIKVLREDRQGDTEDLRREAQTLARLVHPNVVTMHDVGIADGQVFLVMQLVDGVTIDRWSIDRRPGWAEIVAAFRQAGLGLAAAHAADIVHCDFKPNNIMVDHDGSVRVSDFGIARTHADQVSAHGVTGTPGYMAPEQFSGVATAASDQFSFCVALWEVLAGERLFANVAITSDGAMSRGPRRSLPRHARVPARVVRVLDRGLATDANDRFPSMSALLAALAPGHSRRRILAGTAVAAGLAVTALITHETRPASAGSPAIEARPGRPDVGAIHPLTNFGRTACAYAPSIHTGDVVVFDRTEGDAVDLYRTTLAGIQPERLTSAPTWEWRSHPGRHDGEVIHLIHDPDRPAGATITALDLATAKQSTAVDVFAIDTAAIDEAIFYIPLGRLEVRRYTRNRDVAFAAAPPKQEFRYLAASPAGDRLAAVTTSRRLCLIDVVTAGVDCLANAVTHSPPAFSSDGRALYYAAADGLRRRDLSSSIDELLLPDARMPGGLAVAPDGSAIVYSECGPRTQVLDWSTSPPTVIVADPTALQPAVSRDGSVAWIRRSRGVWVLMARTPDGEVVQLTRPDFGPVRSPAFSLDGKSLAFVASAPHPGIHVVGVAATTRSSSGWTERGLIRRLTDDASDARPSWTANGLIGFTRTDDRQISAPYVISSDGGSPRRLGESSRRVVGARGTELLVASLQALYWIDVATGRERPGPAHAGLAASFATLSPNGRWLAFQGGTAGLDVWRLSLDAAVKPELVESFPSGQTLPSIAITDAGNVLATPATWSGDLIAVPARAGTRF